MGALRDYLVRSYSQPNTRDSVRARITKMFRPRLNLPPPLLLLFLPFPLLANHLLQILPHSLAFVYLTTFLETLKFRGSARVLGTK